MPSRLHFQASFYGRSFRALFICVLPLALTSASWCSVAVAEDRPNVLFIAVDDLRPQLNCYGRTQMHTPNLDRLASSGVLFERAYCMVPTCGASRASLMTGVRPSRSRFTSYLTWAEKDAKFAIPLHSHFKSNGYTTISLGKVFHHKQDHAEGWSKPAWRSSKPGYQDAAGQRADTQENKRRWPGKSKHRGAPFESFDAPDEDYPDGDCVREAIEQLEELASAKEQPFFLAVGLLKPHLPFNAPKKYWDLYDPNSIDLPDNYHAPKDAPRGAVHNSGELRAYARIHPSDPVDRETARKMIHGYYACVSFVDAQVGRLLDAVSELGLEDDTIVVLWGDHGWQLGEHGMWNKHSCFETSMHSPLIVSAPGNKTVQPGAHVPALVEFIDIYPSLCELSGLPKPSHLEGSSFLPLMQDPASAGKPYAIGRFGQGDTIRSDTHRYSLYTSNPRGKSAKKEVKTGEMLYDHRSDPDENTNIAAAHAQVVEQLSRELKARQGQN